MPLPNKRKNPGFETILERFNSKLWHYHILVPADIAKAFVKGTDRRVICRLNNKVTFQCALMHKGSGTFFININKSIRDKLKLKEGDSLQVSLKKDESEYGLPLPEELAELMKQDEEGREVFHKLTPGKQRTLLYIIDHVKNTELRLRRAIAIVNHLKRTKGKIDYKQLNEEMKRTF